MNTNTVDPEAPTTEQPDRRPEPSFGYDPQRPALRRPFEGRMLAGVAEGLGRYFGVGNPHVLVGRGAGEPRGETAGPGLAVLRRHDDVLRY